MTSDFVFRGMSSRAVNPNYERVHPAISGVSLTQDEFLRDCDINVQIENYTRLGRPLPAVAFAGDTQEQVQDVNATYLDAHQAVLDVEDAFAQVPLKVREKFHHNPLEMAAFLSDHNNFHEAVSLGLVDAPPEAPKPPVVPAPAASASPAGEPLKGAHAPVAPQGAQGAGS